MMTWTTKQKLSYLMTLPWTVTVERSEEGLVAHVGEIPDAIATGDDEHELARDLWESLWSSLSARLEYQDEIPLPTGANISPMPWDRGDAPPAPRQPLIRQLARGEAWQEYGLVTSTTSTAVLAGVGTQGGSF